MNYACLDAAVLHCISKVAPGALDLKEDYVFEVFPCEEDARRRAAERRELHAESKEDRSAHMRPNVHEPQDAVVLGRRNSKGTIRVKAKKIAGRWLVYERKAWLCSKIESLKCD